MIGLERFLLDTSKLWFLLALVPFILLYLIKPKPKKIIIPSLMFFIRDKDKSNINSFLQKFVNDFLFFLQLLIIILIVFSAAKPFINVPSFTYSDSLVIIIDASASMNAKEDGMTRFDRAKEIAINRLDNRNTIILATDRSQLMLENSGKGRARDTIRSLQARHTTSQNFYDTMVVAENFANTDNSVVFVISDFADERMEEDFFRAKLYLESKGIRVFFEDVSRNKATNVGIIDLDISEQEVIAWVKNFNNRSETFRMKYGDRQEIITIDANDVISFAVTTLPGKSVIELDINDDFDVDNKAYISTPEFGSLEILLISNGNERFLRTALGLMDKINLNIQNPPIVNIGNPDIVILGEINKDLLIPGDINRIRQAVRQDGISLIILAQDNILDLGLDDLLPFELNRNQPINLNQQDGAVISSMPGAYLTPSEMQFGVATKLYQITPNQNSIIFAETNINSYPIITLTPFGRGRILYYGLFDEYSDFRSDLYYPIFWRRAIDTLIGGKTLSELNRNTGYLQIVTREQVIKTPKGDRTGQAITLDYAGFYEFAGFTVAANLLSESEQRLNKDEVWEEFSDLRSLSEIKSKETAERDLTYIFAMIVLVLLIFELFYLKFRGDI
ncbi:MAG: BatA domain-containing protein [Candidatus Woesearchaeota archaeon]